MLIKFGGIVTQGSGSQGGTTFARNRYGSYTRNRTKPVNPRSDRQNNIRAILASLKQSWLNDCSPAERTSWNLYASSVSWLNKLGDTIHLSGYNHFCRTNAAVLNAGLILKEAGPTIFTLGETDPSLAAVVTADDQLVSVTFDAGLGWAAEVGGKLLVYMGTPQNAGVNFFNGPWRYADKISGAVSPPASPQTVACPFAVVTGQKVWVQCRILRLDGRLSVPFQVSVSVSSGV